MRTSQHVFRQLVALLSEVIATGAWTGHGIRSAEQWIGWRTGLSATHCRTLAALAAAADTHPQVAESFQAGELSIDQAGLAIQARPEHHADNAEWARVMTLPQLRIQQGPGDPTCRVRNVMPLPIVLQIPTRNKPRRRNGSVSICRSSRTETGRGACTAASTPIMGRSSTQHCPRLTNDCSTRATTTSRGPIRGSTSPIVLSFGTGNRRERFRINLFMDPAQSATATWINGIAVPDSIARLCLCDGTISRSSSTKLP